MATSAAEKLRRFYQQFAGDDKVLIMINADPDAIAVAKRNLSRFQTVHLTVLDPRYAPTSGSIFQGDGTFLYPDDDAGRAAMLADYQAIVDEVEAKLPELFGRLPKAQVRVERVPEFMEAGAPVAYYNPPPFDGSRPGIFYVNLRSVKEIPRFGMRTLAYHEAIPGHHFQIALAQELDLPLFQSIVFFNGYVEGWALYCEAEMKSTFPLEGQLISLQQRLLRAAHMFQEATDWHTRRPAATDE